MESDEATPLTEQIQSAKERHPGMILLFDFEDHYRAYGEDVQVLAGLGIGGDIGWIENYALEPALRVLLSAGHRVAICERAVRVS
jgi:DNA mismatch repair ATPase MutS